MKRPPDKPQRPFVAGVEVTKPVRRPSMIRAGAPGGSMSGRLAPLDGLRAVAVAVVFVHHADLGRWPGGFLGVDVFFAISAYIITAQLVREWNRTDDLWLRGFYARRFLRLMPALAVLVVIVTPLALMDDEPDVIASAGAAVTYAMDFYASTTAGAGGIFAHTWSLAVEEQFYLIWPVLLLLTLRRNRLGVATLVALFCACLSIAVTAAAAHLRPNDLGDIYRTPFPHLPVIVAGVLLALLTSTADGRHRIRVLSNVAVPTAVLALLVTASLTAQETSLWLYQGGFAAAAVGCTALVGHVVLAPRSIVSRALSLRPVLWLGTRSYGFYLWHFPVLYLLGEYVSNAAVLLMLGFAVSASCTELSWRLVELPLLSYKDRHFTSRRGRAHW